MSLSGFLADGRAVVYNGLKLWSEKYFGGTGILPVRVHRLKTCATNGANRRGGPPHHLFSVLRVSETPMND